MQPHSIHFIRSRFQALRRLDLNSADIEYVKRVLRRALTGLTAISPALRIGYDLYRARVFPDFNLPSSINDISYPPTRFVGRMGRANRNGVSLFYCSTSFNAAVFELKPLVGQCVVIGKWRLMEPLRINHAGYSRKALQRLGSSRSENMLPIFTMDLERDIPAQRYLHEQIAREFTKNVQSGQEHNYKISVAIAEIMLQDVIIGDEPKASINIDAVMYPSIGSFGDSENFAIKPRFVDTAMEPKEAVAIHITGMLNEEDYNSSVVNFSDSLKQNRSIDWQF